MKRIIFTFVYSMVLVTVYSQGSVTIAPGTNFKTSNGVQVNINNMNLVNNGIFIQTAGNGIMRFSGTQNTSIAGNSNISFDRVFLEKAAGRQVSLLRNINIVTELRFISGLFNLNNFGLNLSTTGILSNETNASRAVTIGSGYIEASRVLNAPSSVNIGNLGAIISSSANPGNTMIRRYHRAQSNGSGVSILRYYHIRPAVNSNLNATLRLHYFDAELNGLNEAALTVWNSLNSSTWTHLGFNTKNTSTNYVEKTGIPSLAYFTLMIPPMAAIRTMSNPGVLKETAALSVFPNPVSNFTTITLPAALTEDIQIVLFDARGVQVKSIRTTAFKGTNQVKVDMHDLRPGVYMLKINGLTGINTIRLLKN